MIDYSIDGSFTLVRLNNPPLNVLTFTVLDALVAAIDRANRAPEVRGIIITGSSEHFTAGADVNLFSTVTSDEEAVAISRRFQQAFNRIEQSDKPVVAAVAGMVMGGALECALAAHFRICTSGTRLSLPEVTLGILPGAGGTQRLPRTVGIEAAFRMLLSGAPVTAKEALTLGLVDGICESPDLIAAAKKLLQEAGRPVRASLRTDKISDAATNLAAFAQAVKIASRSPAELIAPRLIVEAVRYGIDQSFDSGLNKEQCLFAACMATTGTRNKIRHFFATRATGKIPELATITPRSITTVAVIGMGSMGAGIAQAFAAAGKKVVAIDVDRAAAQKGVDRIAESLNRKIERGSLSRAKADVLLERITVAADISEASRAEMVIEAVFETVEVKQSIIRKIAAVCPPTTIVATNTSTIDLDLLAEKLDRSERLVGLHFFNPAHSMPLVEVIRRTGTDPAVVATAMNTARELKKTPVLVNNHVGFAVNRLFIPYCVEAYLLLEEGADPHDIDAAMVAFGFPMGPLSIIDMTGIDILAFTNEIMCRAYPYHISLSPVATALIEEGMLGQKTGCGVFRYEGSSRTPHKNPRTDALVATLLLETGGTPRSIGHPEITERLIMRLAAEAFRIMEEQVTRCESDLDVAMVLGTGFPDYRGGILTFARDTGIKKVFSRLEALTAACGERYQPCNYLQSII